MSANSLFLLRFSFLPSLPSSLEDFKQALRKGDLEYLKKQTELLISAGVDVNAVDKFDAIPLKYAITISKHTTEEMKEIYEMLIRSGSDYKKKDTFQKSCLDYAQEYSWRNGFVEIVKEIER